jgi:transposase
MDADPLARENALLKARLAEVEAALSEAQEAQRRLEDILRTSQREQFGKRSEKLSPDQFNLPLEDAELAQGYARGRGRRRQRPRCGARARRRPAGPGATVGICRCICPGSRG